ncbi:MAG TPA: PAC2 family protein [Dehalococcoidales bacterium]|nr:PAC2 family protein [Dehalococcoidales bacterium]
MARQSTLIFLEKPELRQPYLVCGINGWVDGGEAATGTTRYLIQKLRARKFAEMPVDRYHVFQVPGQLSLRPEIKIENGLLKKHVMPKNEFFYWVNPRSEHDLILYLGTEPNTTWEEYAGNILDLAADFGVARIYVLGGVLDKTPHTREASVSCACSSRELRQEMMKYAMQSSNYEGPGSFSITMLHLSQQRKMPFVSVIARATYYPEFNIVIPRNPKAIKAIVLRLDSLLHLNMDIPDLDQEADELEVKLNFMASHNREFQTYIEELEKEYSEVKYKAPLDITANEAVQLAEDFLKETGEE